ncbi:hypothetical protein SAMN05444851_1426 [Aliiroseovarius sediminilitoris]|uniref:DUF5333 domain-containing protein n=2 Tax=Aliiroseovarius sediminilitoris TaxID=1173584 RepID=A0A1I0P859_9RHOB|nr:hypothetical protein SAMN05444851_1426 [Aliiroseovarius sediminilitoris]
MKLRTFAFATAMAATAATGAASSVDYAALRDDSRMHEELLGASIAYLIDENCPTIRLRKFRLLNKAFSLRKHAMTLGYSSKEVLAYVESKAEQDRFRAIAEPMLAKRGVKPGDEESYCAVGRAEIKQGSFAGSLLYES